MPKASIYVETSIVSYLVGWLNQRDLGVAHNQQFTREWWSRRRSDFELFISPVVIDEAGKGDPVLAAQRLEYLSTLAVLEVTSGARSLSTELLSADKDAKKSRTRRAAHLRCCCERNELLADLELHAYREC